MPTIGLDKPYYAVITENASGEETYGSPIAFAQAISADIKVESATGELYASDHLAYRVDEFKSGTLTLNVDQLTPSELRDLIGVTIDAKGVIVQTAEDNRKYVAIGFRGKNPNGTYQYYWLYRVMFGIPASTLNTKGDSITFNTPTIEGTIFRRNKADSLGNHPWMVTADGSASGTNATTIANWFNAVYEPTYTDTDVSLSALAIGSISLTPTFAAGTTSYTAATTNATNTITATPEDNTADVVITVNGDSLTNGGSATWETGENAVVITVTKGSASKTYNVTVTKS